MDSLNHSAASKHAFIDVQLNTFRQRIFREVDAREAADAQLSAEPPAPLDTQSQKTRRLPVLTTGMLFLNAEQFQDFSDRMYALIDEFEELNPAQERNVDAQRAYYMVSVLQDSSGSDPAHVQSGTATHP